jgi:hypothetical protein
MPGVETTGLIPYLFRPGSTLPKVIGHFIFWPIAYDPHGAYNGAVWDQLMEPGQLFDAMQPLIGAHGVIQLNHPLASGKIGRDEGYLRMLGYNPATPLPDHDDQSAMGMLYHGAPGGHRNIDYDTQEVLNGASIISALNYRAVWHAFLNQNIVRAGTANSDTHSLSIGPMGYPRNVVLGNFAIGTFDVNAFNDAVRKGQMVGTNGPFIDAHIAGMDGTMHGPSTQTFQPATGAMLEVEVRCVPWIPVSEVRIVVNGRVARTISGAEIMRPNDPFGIDGVVRYHGTFAVADLTGGHDAWISVEAGEPLPASVDTPDATTHMTDGVIDRVDGDGDGNANETEIETPASDTDPRYHIDVVAPGTLPFAFTNPFLIDVDGNGWTAPGLPR